MRGDHLNFFENAESTSKSNFDNFWSYVALEKNSVT